MEMNVLEPVCDTGLVEELVEEWQLVGRSFLRTADRLVELLRRARRDGVEDLLPAEVSCALKIDTKQARDRLLEAETLAERLLTRQALADGVITVGHAQAIVSETLSMSAELAGEVERRVLTRAPDQTVPQLRASLRRAVIRVDAAAAERRRREARRAAGVWLQPVPDGMAQICVRMAAEQAVATMAALAAVTPRPSRGMTAAPGSGRWTPLCP